MRIEFGGEVMVILSNSCYNNVTNCMTVFQLLLFNYLICGFFIFNLHTEASYTPAGIVGIVGGYKANYIHIVIIVYHNGLKPPGSTEIYHCFICRGGIN